MKGLYDAQENPEAVDGRNINLKLGTLSGEASHQVSKNETAEGTPLETRAFPYIPSRQPGETPAYYDRPLLKAPVWIWSIPAYFYVGGATGMATTLGAAAQFIAPRGMRSLVLQSRWIGTVGGALSAVLLIHDLGRPMRFLNMLRVFRVTSPMSMGSWILTVFSTAAGAAAVLPFGPKWFRPLAGVFGPLAGLLGLGLTSYTGVLISQTAVPVWQQAHRITPILFLASGTAAAASLFDFLPLNREEQSAVTRFGMMGKVVELAAAFALEAEVRKVSRVARPLDQGFSGLLWNAAKALTAVSIILNLIPGESRGKRVATGVFGSLASLSLRFGIFQAGKRSANDPRASFEQQRHLS